MMCQFKHCVFVFLLFSQSRLRPFILPTGLLLVIQRGWGLLWWRVKVSRVSSLSQPLPSTPASNQGHPYLRTSDLLESWIEASCKCMFGFPMFLNSKSHNRFIQDNLGSDCFPTFTPSIFSKLIWFTKDWPRRGQECSSRRIPPPWQTNRTYTLEPWDDSQVHELANGNFRETRWPFHVCYGLFLLLGYLGVHMSCKEIMSG